MRANNLKSDQLRRAILIKTRMLAQRGIQVTQRGTGAYCKFNKRTGKPELINLPVIPPEPTEQFLAALEGYIDHEVAHALETVSKDWTGSLNDENNVAGVGRGIRNNVINVVEDVRIENVMPLRFPGSEANLEAVRQFMIDQLWAPQLDKLGDIFDPKVAGKARTAALVPFLRAMGGHKACIRFVEDYRLMELYAPLLEQIPDLADRFKALKSTKEAAELAEDLIRAIKKPKKKKPVPPPPPPQPEPEQPQEPDIPDLDDLMDEPEPPPKQPEKSDEQSLGEADGGSAEDEPLEPKDNGQDSTEDAEQDAEGGEEPSDEDASEGDGASDEGGDDAAGPNPEPEKDVEGKDGEGDDPLSSGGDGKKNVTLGEAIKQLTATQRTALILYNSKRMTVEQIAERTKRTPGQVTRTLRDARRRLSVIMEGKSK